VDNFPPEVRKAFRPFGCILALHIDAVGRLSGESAWPHSGSHHSASARMDDAPAATIGKMTIPEKWTRSSGKAVASWRDIESEDREKSVRKDITQRLKCICQELPAPEFQALVAKMTTEQLRGERTLHRWIPLT